MAGIAQRFYAVSVISLRSQCRPRWVLPQDVYKRQGILLDDLLHAVGHFLHLVDLGAGQILLLIIGQLVVSLLSGLDGLLIVDGQACLLYTSRCV